MLRVCIGPDHNEQLAFAWIGDHPLVLVESEPGRRSDGGSKSKTQSRALKGDEIALGLGNNNPRNANAHQIVALFLGDSSLFPQIDGCAAGETERCDKRTTRGSVRDRWSIQDRPLRKKLKSRPKRT